MPGATRPAFNDKDKRVDVVDSTREMIAYGLIGLIVLISVPVLVSAYSRRKREKLRRQGIKRYGH